MQICMQLAYIMRHPDHFNASETGESRDETNCTNIATGWHL